MKSLWRNREFNLLWTSQTLVDFGDGIATLALALLMLVETGSPIYAGLLGSPGTKGKPIGWQSEAEWDEALRIMTEAGVVKPGLKGADMFTNSFVK